MSLETNLLTCKYMSTTFLNMFHKIQYVFLFYFSSTDAPSAWCSHAMITKCLKITWTTVWMTSDSLVHLSLSPTSLNVR